MKNGAFALLEQMLYFSEYFQIHDISKASLWSKGLNVLSWCRLLQGVCSAHASGLQTFHQVSALYMVHRPVIQNIIILLFTNLFFSPIQYTCPAPENFVRGSWFQGLTFLVIDSERKTFTH